MKPNHENTIAIGRKDIANLIGTDTESLNRTLSDFKDERLIKITDNVIAIINMAKLDHVAK